MKSKKNNIEIDVICNILLTTSSEPLKSSTLLVQKRLTLLFFVKMLNSDPCFNKFHFGNPVNVLVLSIKIFKLV